jgi:hypothetical protein
MEVGVAKNLMLHMVVQFHFTSFVSVVGKRSSERVSTSAWEGESGFIPKGLARFDF